MSTTATIPAIPSESREAALGCLTVAFTHWPTGHPEKAEGGHFHVPAGALPAQLLAYIEARIKARLERTES